MKPNFYEELPEELKEFYESTLIITHLALTNQSIRVAPYNKIADAIGVPRTNITELKELTNFVLSTPELSDIMAKGQKGEIDILALLGMTPKETLINSLPYISVKEENLAVQREQRSLLRLGANFDRMLSGLKDALNKELSTINFTTAPPRERVSTESSYSIVATTSDWHVGALVDKDGVLPGYSFKDLERRMEQYTDEIIDTAEMYGVDEVYLIHLGDWIEHINMRNVNQAFEAEFPATTQIAKATRLIINMLNKLSDNVNVTFGGIGGNHDRFQGNKGDSVYNDNVAVVIMSTLQLIQEHGGLPNVTIIDNLTNIYSLECNVAGRAIKAVHGDAEKKGVDHKIPKHIKEYPVDILLMGHIHTSRTIQEDFSRFHLYCGSPMGANTYSLTNGFPTTDPMQSIIILPHDNDGYIVKNVSLD